MSTPVKLDYRKLFQSWFPMWAKLTILTGVIIFAIPAVIVPEHCDFAWYGPRYCRSNIPDIARFAFQAAAVFRFFGLLSSL